MSTGKESETWTFLVRLPEASLWCPELSPLNPLLPRRVSEPAGILRNKACEQPWCKGPKGAHLGRGQGNILWAAKGKLGMPRAITSLHLLFAQASEHADILRRKL